MLYLIFDALRSRLDAIGLYGVFALLDQVQFRALAGAGIAFAIVLLLGRRVIAALLRLKIGDPGMTDADALRTVTAGKANTPTMGGLLIVGAALVVTLMLADVSARWVQLALVVMLWMAALGGVDDWLKLTASRRGVKSRQGLYAWEKLVFQLGCGLVVGYFAYAAGITGAPVEAAHTLNLPFQKTYDTGTPTRELSDSLVVLTMPAYILVATLMVAGMSNAVNITDGMDGLAAGISGVVALGALALALIAGTQSWAQTLLVPYVPGTAELAVVAGALGGACLGFLWFNCSPAQVFMGDTGALCLGAMIGFLAVATRQEFVVLLMCGVCLAEIASVVIQVGCFKLTGGHPNGRRVFRVAPYHHHLHLGGWTEQQVVVRFWIVTAVLTVIALASIKVR
ncbi:MAG: phospho-N-acetylmuramoyl-pentapeptide-transferase [Phycisphaerales bacterium]|nr:phospho-N-acetylmuramoyl-pentapeptide-transferase [Phycisphaerales bacterium]